MKKIWLFGPLLLAGCATVPTGSAEAASYKRCPDGSQVRRNVSCPTIPSFSAQSATFGEGDGTVTITISKTGSNGKSSSINYATSDGTATAGSDYLARSGSLTFGATQTTSSFTVPILDDNHVESTETFGVHLSPASNATIARDAVISILDNDTAAPAPSTQTCPDGSVILATQQCPAAPPTPPATGDIASPTTPSGAASNTIFGLPAIASPFDFNLGLIPNAGDGSIPPSAAPDNVGAFRFICGAGQVLRDDPIVYPGQPGKSHLHQFYGNESADANSTYTSLRTTGTSTCNNNTAYPNNRSAYWTPAMMDSAGHVVKPDYVAIYYKRRPLSDPTVSNAANAQFEGYAVPIPNGLRFVFGRNMLDPAATPTGAAYFNCDGPTAVPGHYATITDVIPNCPVRAAGLQQNRLGAIIAAPECWNGATLDSADHRSHVGYASYGSWGYLKCDAQHPYVIPTFQVGVWYTIDAQFAAGGWHLSSDEMIAGAAPGTTLHGDWFGAWDDNVVNMWTVAGCINNLLNCSGGDLGNGKQLIGAGAPSYGWTNPDRLINIP